MNYTEEQIIEKTKQIIKDLLDEFYSDELIRKILFKENDTPLIGKYKGQKHPTWTVSVEALFDNVDFLHISDETGEPLYYQNFNTIVFNIDKTPEGKYFKVNEE